MFNLNIPPSSLLGVDGSSLGCSTPKTPEILNSLIAMTNPMDTLHFTTETNGSPNAVSVSNFNVVANAQTSQDSSQSSSSTSPLESPAGTINTPSVQQTCSQLIKAGLKLSIQSKRKLSTCDSSSGSEQPISKCSKRDEDCDESTDDESERKSIPKGLTPEDEDRRRRRRERNKIAATKCRMKKRERTQNLIKESEQLDTQNVDLKNQVSALEKERRKLLDMLNVHSQTCIHPNGLNLPIKLRQSPASRYLSQLDLDTKNKSCCKASSVLSLCGEDEDDITIELKNEQLTAIPPMSSIHFSRSNGFKASNELSLPLQTSVDNAYCKASPSTQDMGYMNPSIQDEIRLATLPSRTVSANEPSHQPIVLNSRNHSPLSEYIPNCDTAALSLMSRHVNSSVGGGDNSALLASVASPLSNVSTPTHPANEFVKNELVDSQSPYTTAQSAERFLFETNCCDTFVDIKHAVSLHAANHSNSNGLVPLATGGNSNSLLDYQSIAGGNIAPFHDQLSIKNDYLHDPDLLALSLTGDSEFVDLDTGVAASFLSNGGCLA